MNGKEVYFSEEVINIAAEIEKIIKKIFPLITNMTPYFKIIQLEILLRNLNNPTRLTSDGDSTG